MNKLLLTALVATILAHLIIWASSMDYQDELVEEAHYREMVCAGYWPDYKNEKPNCKENLREIERIKK